MTAAEREESRDVTRTPPAISVLLPWRKQILKQQLKKREKMISQVIMNSKRVRFLQEHIFCCGDAILSPERSAYLSVFTTSTLTIKAKSRILLFGQEMPMYKRYDPKKIINVSRKKGVLKHNESSRISQWKHNI